jgi:hypothetical protein
MRHTAFGAILLPLVAGALACADPVSGPSARPLLPSALRAVRGDLPTATLVEVAEIIIHDALDVIEVRTMVNGGIVTSTENGQAMFALRLSLTVDDGSTSSGQLGPVLKLLIDKLAEPRPDPFFYIWTAIEWDGTSASGGAMGATLTADYVIELVRIGQDGVEQSLGTSTGTLPVLPGS